MGLIAFYVRDWRIIQIIIGAPIFLLIALRWYCIRTNSYGLKYRLVVSFFIIIQGWFRNQFDG